MPTDKATVERALLVAARDCDVYKVKEEGPNRGKRIKEYLQWCGLPEGNPWCAAFVTACLIEEQWPKSELPVGPAAVRNWRHWAQQTGRLITANQAGRGDLFLWVNPNGNGHIGWVVRTEQKKDGLWIYTIEGNSNRAGSREGDRVLRNERKVTQRMQFIRLVK
jgi:hypothetical protein